MLTHWGRLIRLIKLYLSPSTKTAFQTSWLQLSCPLQWLTSTSTCKTYLNLTKHLLYLDCMLTSGSIWGCTKNAMSLLGRWFMQKLSRYSKTISLKIANGWWDFKQVIKVIYQISYLAPVNKQFKRSIQFLRKYLKRSEQDITKAKLGLY